MKKHFQFSFETFPSSDELDQKDQEILKAAREVTKNAYAPYSRFHVGAVAQLSNGKTVSGTNQENASFPVGICAERVLLSTASSLFPGEAVETIAISYNNLTGNSGKPISPCGICRQSLLEYEQRGGVPMRIIMSGLTGEVIILESAKQLLPFSFDSSDMK